MSIIPEERIKNIITDVQSTGRTTVQFLRESNFCEYFRRQGNYTKKYYYLLSRIL